MTPEEERAALYTERDNLKKMLNTTSDNLAILRMEVVNLLNILSARRLLDEGFKGMGYNILQEKAGLLKSQIRRIERLLK